MEKCKNCEDLHNGSVMKLDEDGYCVFCGRDVTSNSRRVTLDYPTKCTVCGEEKELIRVRGAGMWCEGCVKKHINDPI